MRGRREAWGQCRVCMYERRTGPGGSILLHNRWDDGSREMVRCEGSGKPPLPRKFGPFATGFSGR